jgi:glycosyltransferase involved in cell wall biosynthesis
MHTTVRVDLHLHSYASNVTDYYAANSFAIPESYSDPRDLYRVLKRGGMSLVTLTDHNSIDGVRELLELGHKDVFMSAEMTTTFPEDGCNIHVTVANMTEAQFREVDRLRGNVYEMLAYVEAEIASEARAPAGNKLAYWMTHPLMSTQNRPYGREGSLSLEHLEKSVLLIPAFEVRNGTRTRALNEFTLQWLAALDAAAIERLANEHGISPTGEQPWRKAFLAGSDDHSGINPGRTFTEFEHQGAAPPTANELVLAIRARRTRPAGQYGGPVTLAHAMLKLLHDGRRRARPDGKATPLRASGPLDLLLRMMFESESVTALEKVRLQVGRWLAAAGRKLQRRRGVRPFEDVLGGEIHALVGDAAFRARLGALERTDDRIFLVVSTLVNRLFAYYSARLGNDAGNVVCTVKELVALVSSNVLVSLPYLLAYLHQSSDRLIVRDVRKAFGLAERERLVLVTDTYFDVNGVSRTIRRMTDEAARRGIELCVVTCLSPEELARHGADPEIRARIGRGLLKIFPSVVSTAMPQYSGLRVHFPPFLELLKFVQEQGFTKMQISTPGTVGVAGLLAAKVLQIETSATYHTCFPEYVEDLTKDVSLEALAWRYMILFYRSVDEVVVPSRYIAKLLHTRGLRNRALLVLDRWVDAERFHPRHRVADYWEQRGIEGAAGKTKFVYVGRVSVEKNLSVLATAFRGLCAERDDVHLVVIGDGPYRPALEQQLSGLPVTFTGMLEGDELSRALASCDAKLFPSTTDTWGNAPLEAQASGLPVVVSDMGGPQELMLDGATGIKVRGRDTHGLIDAMRRLCDSPTRARMSRAARRFIEANRIDEPFTAILDAAAYRRRVRVGDEAAPPAAPPPGLKLIGAVLQSESTRWEVALET